MKWPINFGSQLSDIILCMDLQIFEYSFDCISTKDTIFEVPLGK